MSNDISALVANGRIYHTNAGLGSCFDISRISARDWSRFGSKLSEEISVFLDLDFQHPPEGSECQDLLESTCKEVQECWKSHSTANIDNNMDIGGQDLMHGTTVKEEQMWAAFSNVTELQSGCGRALRGCEIFSFAYYRCLLNICSVWKIHRSLNLKKTLDCESGKRRNNIHSKATVYYVNVLGIIDT